MKKALSMLLVLVMLLGMMPVTTFAVEEAPETEPVVNVLKSLALSRAECEEHAFSVTEIIMEPGLVSKGSAIQSCETCGYTETVEIPELMQAGIYAYQDDDESVAVPYRIYYPSSYDSASQSRYPIVIFFHGSGNRGTNNKNQTASAIIPRLVNLDNCIVLAPQCDISHQWVNTPWGNGSYDSHAIAPSIYMDAAIALLDDIILTNNVDRNRVYAIGTSMGGYAAWNAAMEYPEKFAAVIPVCGAADPSRASAVLGVAIWAFHGDVDKTVPVSGSREMIEAIKALGGVDVRYTEYVGVDHAAWVPAYSEPELTDWLFSQTKHSHAYESTVTAPTCTEQGYTTYTCACGDSYVEDYVAATGHTYENGICTGCGATQPGPVITQQPESISAERLDEVMVSAAAQGEDLVYRWYYRCVGETDFRVSNSTGDTFRTVMSSDLHGCEVYCVITDGAGNSATSDVAVLSLSSAEEPATPPARIPGDLNGDSVVNNKDLIRLFRYLSGWDVEIY